MATRAQLNAWIDDIVDDASFEDINDRIDESILEIAGGIIIPDGSGRRSPPLPDLYKIDTVDTATDAAYVSLPDEFHRDLIYVVDSSGCRINPPSGGDYESFRLFLNGITNKGLTESGSIYSVARKGLKLYYQGIPAASVALTVHFYELPTILEEDDDVPSCIPSFLQRRLIVHRSCARMYGEGIEDGETSRQTGEKYHSARFYEALMELTEHIGEDAEPVVYANNDGLYGMDGAVCDGGHF